MKSLFLKANHFVVFTTRDYALENQLSIAAASKQLHRLAQKKILTQLTRGIWANTHHPYFHSFRCVPYLLGNEQGYVSFLTALHRHGILSQIPIAIQVATTGHTRTLSTPIGRFEFLKLKPEMMKKGIQWSESHLPYRIATPEKALLDTLYIATRKKRRFASLPKLDFKDTPFKFKKLQQWTKEHGFPILIRKALSKRITNLK